MRLKLLRICSRSDYTCGVLIRADLPKPRFLCATLEDERREVKVFGETRIPAGEYPIKLRTEGGLTEKYAAAFPDIHRGMLWLQGVPGFEWIYIHRGNTDEDTEGCILVGETLDFEEGFLGRSTAAYRYIYPLITAAIEIGELVTIQIEDIA